MIIEKLIDKDVLSDTEKQIAHYILNKENHIENLTSIELGKKSYTSQSSVVRLYKKLGMKSYREFISQVIVERNEYFNIKDVIEDIHEEQRSSFEGIIKIISGLYVQTMVNTNRTIDKNILVRVCNRILSAKVVDVYAFGKDKQFAQKLTEKLQTLGIYCTCHSVYNPSYIKLGQNKIQRVSLIIYLSDDGNISQNIANLLKEKNEYSVAICSTKEKELMLTCQESINFNIGSYRCYEDICFAFAIEYIINIIYLTLLIRSQKGSHMLP